MVQVFPWQRPYIIRGYYITIVVHLMWGGLTSYDETNLRSCCESVFESRQMFSDSLMMLGLKSPVADIYNIYISTCKILKSGCKGPISSSGQL